MLQGSPSQVAHKTSVSLNDGGVFQLLDTIGDGSYGKVKRAVNQDDQSVVAVKMIRKKQDNARDDRRQLEKEIIIHRALTHENIIRLLGIEEDPSYLYIVLEFAAGGELFDKIVPDVGVEEDLAHFYFTQLMAGVEYCHSQGVAHRDLKPENMLIDDCGNLKISDFGLSTVFRYGGKIRPLHTACGSPPYVAPEIHSNGYSGEAVDIWSAGVILYVLLVGNTPWEEPTKHSPEFMAYATRKQLDFEPWCHIPPDILELLRNILSVNPSQRYNLEDIHADEWFKRQNPFLTDGLCNDPIALAQKLMTNLYINGEMDTPSSESFQVSYTQPEFVSSNSFRRITDTTNGMPLASFSQPDAALARQTSSLLKNDRCTPNSDGDDISMSQARYGALETSSQRERRFIDLCPSERLTRFYSKHDATKILKRLSEILEVFLVPHNVQKNAHTIKFTTVDKRRCPLNGEIRIQSISSETRLVMFRKTKADPLEFKRFFKAVTNECGLD